MASSLPRTQECHNCMRKHRPCPPEKEYKRCLGCHLTSYCDPQCQEEHWYKVHKKHCKVIAGTKELSYTVHGDDCVTCINHKTDSLKMKSDDEFDDQAEAGTPFKANVRCMADETVVRISKEYLKQFGTNENMSMKAPFRELSGMYLPSKYDEHLAHMWRILQVIHKIYFAELFSENIEKELLVALEDHILFLRAKLWKLYTIFGDCALVEHEVTDGNFLNGKAIKLVKKVHDVIGPMGKFGCKLTHNLWWSLFLNHFEGLDNFEAKHCALAEFTPSCFEGNAYPKLKEVNEKYKDHPHFKTFWPVMGGSGKISYLPIELRVIVPPNTSCCICKELITAPNAVIYSVFSTVLDPQTGQVCCPKSYSQAMKGKSPIALITQRIQADGGRATFCSVEQNPRCVESLETFLNEDLPQEGFYAEYVALRSVAKSCDNCLRRSSSCHRCEDCKSAQYCSTHCQLEDWEKYHKSVCGEMKEKKDKKLPCSKKQKEDLLETEEAFKLRRQAEGPEFLGCLSELGMSCNSSVWNN